MRTIHSDNAPKAIGPYSQGVEANGFIFCSGQTPLVPETNVLVAGGVKEQTKQVLENLGAVLSAAGVGFESVVSVNVYLRDMKDFNDMNTVYAEFFTSDTKPARVTVAVAGLPKEALVEIGCIAKI